MVEQAGVLGLEEVGLPGPVRSEHDEPGGLRATDDSAGSSCTATGRCQRLPTVARTVLSL